MGRNEPGLDAVPRAASTLVILRDRNGPEVLLTVRPENLRFMGGFTVFPGGAVSEADADPGWEERSRLSRAGAAAALKEDTNDALAAYICAIREAFEEVGFLQTEGDRPIPREAAETPESFLAAATELGVVLRTDLMVPSGRWVTPLGSPIRFDARFFIVRAHPDWEPTPDPSEVAEAFWSTPAAALEHLRSGELTMVPPTIEMLQRLDLDPDVGSIMNAMSGPGATEGDRSERFSAFVRRVVAPNPSLMTGPGTNTYIVGAGPTCVIDPAVADSEYIDEIVNAAPDMEAILVTHRHPDHIGGIAALVERTRVPVRAFGSEPAGGVAVDPISDEEILEFGGARLRALHTPGHAPDHLCFYMEGAAVLFSGDNILGSGTAVISPPEGNMRTYLASVARLQDSHISRIFPGHFAPLDGGDEVVRRYLSHRRQRNEAILDSLSRGPLTIGDIVARVYSDTPEQLHPIAVHQVQAHLDMLHEEGSVFPRGNRWFVTGVDYSE
ncbi:MAG TPA: MBL fold metallo-hydrolase [Actinomycetota bacterium]|nr:MBL fold metallo-hydrolase [Actinomycetota bacterium]